MLKAKTKAPDFTLPSSQGGEWSLKGHRDKKIILVFYPGDWTSVCTSELGVMNEAIPLFSRYNAQPVGISVDSRASHTAFSNDRNLRFDLLSDFEPKGKISKQYGVYNESKGTSKRALFIIDEQGDIVWSYLSPEDINPGVDGIIDALERMSGPGGT